MTALRDYAALRGTRRVPLFSYVRVAKLPVLFLLKTARGFPPQRSVVFYKLPTTSRLLKFRKITVIIIDRTRPSSKNSFGGLYYGYNYFRKYARAKAQPGNHPGAARGLSDRQPAVGLKVGNGSFT